jgi:hypothetical protein
MAFEKQLITLPTTLFPNLNYRIADKNKAAGRRALTRWW